MEIYKINAESMQGYLENRRAWRTFS